MTLPESVRNHPYTWSSVALHMLLLGCLLIVGQVQNGKAPAAQPIAPSPAVVHAREEKLQRQIQTMERIKRILNETNASDKAIDTRGTQPPESIDQQQAPALKPAQQAMALAAEIERTLQDDKARELARILHIPEQAAREKLNAERQSSKQLPLEQLVQRANEALVLRQRQREQQRNGVQLAGEHNQGAPGGGDAQRGSGADAPAPARGLGSDPDSAHTVVERRNYDAEIGTPIIDAAQVRAGKGRILGAGGTFANRVYLDSWYLIGPFAGVGPQSIDNSYPPERMIDLDGVYAGTNGSAVSWQYQQSGQYPLIPAGYTESAVYYGYTEVDMDRERDVLMSLGADDDGKLWVNDQLVWRSGNNIKPWYRTHFMNLKGRIDTLNLNEVTRVVHLHKGRNTLLFKLYNSSGATFISLVMAPTG